VRAEVGVLDLDAAPALRAPGLRTLPAAQLGLVELVAGLAVGTHDDHGRGRIIRIELECREARAAAGARFAIHLAREAIMRKDDILRLGDDEEYEDEDEDDEDLDDEVDDDDEEDDDEEEFEDEEEDDEEEEDEDEEDDEDEEEDDEDEAEYEDFDDGKDDDEDEDEDEEDEDEEDEWE
jgi:hypothetical protein